MAISYINTIEVESIASELSALADEFSTEINNLFQRFSEVPTVTQEWFGGQASFYFNSIAKDKDKYVEFANKLKDISNKLYSDVTEIETCLKKNQNGEE